MAAVVAVAGFLAAVERAVAVRAAFVPRWLAASADLVETNLTVGGAYSPGTPVDTGVAQAGWQRRTTRDRVTFTNAVPYIGALERGWSRQAPQGFVGLVRLHWTELQRDALAQIGHARASARLTGP